ncbi:hypothetical protein CDAR_43661 [Caerostris darwini]|uniref:Transmembrane protein n=1 Tax=Caerostris darwini TaxID=1538125 RepID=A0AAV4WGG0_9ARAC|nr:hypothetical protein CDAR_43661 [Caerostris darwini]
MCVFMLGFESTFDLDVVDFSGCLSVAKLCPRGTSEKCWGGRLGIVTLATGGLLTWPFLGVFFEITSNLFGGGGRVEEKFLITLPGRLQRRKGEREREIDTIKQLLISKILHTTKLPSLFFKKRKRSLSVNLQNFFPSAFPNNLPPTPKKICPNSSEPVALNFPFCTSSSLQSTPKFPFCYPFPRASKDSICLNRLP